MKHEQVTVDYVSMLISSLCCLALVFSGWVFLKLIQAIFWLPSYLEKNEERLRNELKQPDHDGVADDNANETFDNDEHKKKDI